MSSLPISTNNSNYVNSELISQQFDQGSNINFDSGQRPQVHQEYDDNAIDNSTYHRRTSDSQIVLSCESRITPEECSDFDYNSQELPLGCSPNLAPTAYEKLHSIETSVPAGIPLHTPWTFWIDKTFRGSTAAEYLANLKKVYKVATIQSFWAVYNNIPRVDEISAKYSYHLMRGDRRPMWEDEINQTGGTWKLKIAKKDTVLVWRELLLAAIGEQFDGHLAPEDDICGISVSVKERDDLVQIWNTDASLTESASVLQKVHSLVPDVTFIAVFYKPHQAHHAFEGEKKSPSPHRL